MADTETQAKPVRGIKFPIALEANGRQFSIQHADTVELWYLYGEYEGLMASIAPADPDAQPNLDREKSRQMINMMISLCEMCHDHEGNPVIFKNSFGAGDQTPRALMRKVLKELFGDFLAGNGPDGFQPLIMDLGEPLMGVTN